MVKLAFLEMFLFSFLPLVSLKDPMEVWLAAKVCGDQLKKLLFKHKLKSILNIVLRCIFVKYLFFLIWVQL